MAGSVRLVSMSSYPALPKLATMSDTTALVLALAVVLISLSILTIHRRLSKANSFPGPTSIPIIGNVLPSQRIGHTLSALGEKYGERFIILPAAESSYATQALYTP